MEPSTSNFRFLRCLFLCAGLVSTPATVLAQVMNLTSGDGAFNPQTAQVEDELAQQQSGRDRLKPQALTFKPLDQTQTGETVVAGETEQEQLKKSKKSKQSKASKKSKRSKQSKQSKRSKQSKHSKRSKTSSSTSLPDPCGRCDTILFESIVQIQTEFVVEFNTSSEILIQVFADEPSYTLGYAPLQTIEYESACYAGISEPVQLGDFWLTGIPGLDTVRDLTFEYRPERDRNRRDVILTQPGTDGIVRGLPDRDAEAYVVVFDAKGGKRCKQYKKYKKQNKISKLNKRAKSAEVFIQKSVTNEQFKVDQATDSEVLVQIFDD